MYYYWPQHQCGCGHHDLQLCSSNTDASKFQTRKIHKWKAALPRLSKWIPSLLNDRHGCHLQLYLHVCGDQMPGSKMIYLINNYFIITRNHFQDFSKKLTLTRSEILNLNLQRFSEQLGNNNKTFYKITKIVPMFWLVKNLWFIVAVYSQKHFSYFLKAIDHTFYGFTGVITHLGCWENARKAWKSISFGSWFTSFSCVLPTSQ